MSGGGALAKPIGSWWRRPGREARMLVGMLAGLLLLAGGAMLAGHLPAAARAAPDYVVDSGVSVVERDIFWISDDAVVFVTGKPNRYNANIADQIMIWRPALGRAPGAFTTLAPLGELTYMYSRLLCLRGDTLSFTVREPGTAETHVRYLVRLPGPGAGPMARPEILSRERFEGRPPTQSTTRSRFNKFSCRVEILPEHIPFGRWLDLDPADGVVLLFPPGVRTEDEVGQPAQFYRPSSAAPRALDIDRGAIIRLSEIVRFDPFRGAYFLRASYHSENRPVDGCVLGWWLWPDGRTESICLPPRAKSRDYWPTKLGTLLARWDHDKEGNVRTSGMHLYAEGRLVWLLPGFTDKLAVSPDGCKVAFPHAAEFDDWKQFGRTKLKVIDLCRHREHLLPSGSAVDKPPMLDRFEDQ